MTTLSIQRTVGGVLTSADSATIRIDDATGGTALAPTIVAPTSAGAYNYTISTLPSGLYTVVWTFSVSGQDDDVSTHVVNVDASTTRELGVSLATIEQRLAARIGPYEKRFAGSGSSTGLLVCAAMKTSRDLGGYEELYILRRGRNRYGTLIPNFNPDDRQRAVVSFANTTGALTPDREWNVAPAVDEEFELHALDPEMQLRPAVQWGLERCFFWDRAVLSVSGGLRSYSLADSVPWLTDPSLIASVQSAYPNSVIPESRELWWRPKLLGNLVYLDTNWLGAADLSVTALRPHSSYVNGDMSYSGPNDDDDVLAVDINYALISAHVQCWINFTDRLSVLAASGLRLTATQVADKFNQMSAAIARQQPEQLRIRWDMSTDLAQVGNVGADPT
jgi:hypothetical protein